MIPAPRNKEIKWIATDPMDFKTKLEDKNGRENQMITPVIKFIKYLNFLHNKPYDSFIIENHAISRRYPENELKHYLYQFIDDLFTEDQNEQQVAFVNKLKSGRKNLINLEKGNFSDYIDQELQKFLPMPN
jgi:hypothetical protein